VIYLIIPIRCFTCGKLIGDKWESYKKALMNGKTPSEALDELNITRYCCRRMFLSHVELIDEILQFYAYRRGESEK